MKNITFLLLLCLCFASMSFIGIGKKSFEGSITYKTEVIFKNQADPNNWFYKQKYGDSLIIHWNKNGDFKRQYFNTGSYGNDYQIYNHKTNMLYAKFKGFDTLYQLNCAKNGLENMNKTVGDNQNIFERECKSVSFEGIDAKGKTYTSTFYYAGWPYIKPGKYRKYKDWFMNKAMSEMKSPYLKLKIDLGEFMVEFTAINIKQTDLPETTFVVPSNLPKALTN